MIFWTSDWHFRHFNIITYCNRPFQSAQEMDEALIKKHNQYVKPTDTVFFLGDLGMGNPSDMKNIISRLNGRLIMIRGNHDRWGVETYYNMGFNAVLETASIKVGQMTLTMSHYPRKTLWAIIKTFIFYIRKMRSKNRTVKDIWLRLKRELTMYNNVKGGDYHLHGHVHSKVKMYGTNIECGVDCWDYKPVSLKEILRLIDQHRREK